MTCLREIDRLRFHYAKKNGCLRELFPHLREVWRCYAKENPDYAKKTANLREMNYDYAQKASATRRTRCYAKVEWLRGLAPARKRAKTAIKA